MTYPGNQPTLPNQSHTLSTPSKRSLAWLSRWWDAGPGHKAALFAAIPLLFVCACCSASLIFAATPYGQQLARETAATETAQAASAAQATATAHEYALLHPAPTKAPTATSRPTGTPQPTATATANATAAATARPTSAAHPTATATPRPAPPPTATPVPPTATPCADPCNPWGYNFVPGNLIYSPPSAFCSYFACINNFWNGSGYVVECNDAMYSKSGGIQGACSYHGGVWRPLYSH